jgi:hypothetical protein
MKGFLLNLDTFEIGNTKVYDYNSIDLSKVSEYINSLDKSWFEYMKTQPNTNIEKICYDYYDDTDYYDLILFINGRDMLHDMAYDSDTIIDQVENSIKDYEFAIFGNDQDSIVNTTRDKLKASIESNQDEKNLKLLYIKLIKKRYINEVKRNIDEIISNQKDMFRLVDYLND